MAGRQRAALKAEESDFAEVDEWLAQQAVNWLRWREAFPTRAFGGIRRTDGRKPGELEQLPWHSYTIFTAKNRILSQGWLLTPLLVPFALAPTQSLTGAPASATLFRTTMGEGNSQRGMQHFTNVYRTTYLAEQRPMVKSVAPRNVEKCFESLSLTT